MATCSERQNWLIKLQRVMLALREVGNEKVELTSQMLDLVRDISLKYTCIIVLSSSSIK